MGKVAKGYDAVARNNLLFVEFESPNLQDHTAQDLFKSILIDSFDKNLEYKITGVQKGTANSFAWVVAATPNQATKIREGSIRFHHEILHSTIPRLELGRRRTDILD